MIIGILQNARCTNMNCDVARNTFSEKKKKNTLLQFTILVRYFPRVQLAIS